MDRALQRNGMARIGKNQLVKLQKKYKTDEAIAKLYGITRQAVHRLRNKYKVPVVNNKQEERNLEIIALHQSGISVLKLAKRFKLSSTHTYRIIKNVDPDKR